MNFRLTLKPHLGPFLPLLLGFVAFLFITGGKILRPTYINWLKEGDPSQSWLGWQFFRYSPLLQWPIGANPNWGMDIGSSIVFTDSIPLLAFIFKPLNSFLPDTFQYFGLWLLICFLLQSLFAWKLLSLFTQERWLLFIGSLFFILAPACLSRLNYHFSLFGQWVLLAGLYFYFTKNFSIFRWIALLVAVTLIHAYLLVMVLAIWSADLIQRCLLKQMGIVKSVSYFFTGCVCIAIIMWAAGYFMVGGGIETQDFGFYRMNLLSLINPNDQYLNWSKLLRDQKGGAGDYEGFNYLGLGMLGLGLIAVYELVRNVRTKPKIRISPVLIPILTICLVFFLFAISNHLAVGPYEIFSYDLPSITRPLANAFRSSGRFFWPFYYVIYLAIFYLLFTRLRRNTAITLCVVMLFVQVIDSTDIWRWFRYRFTDWAAWESTMRSPFWSDIAHQYRKIIFILPHNMSDNWKPLSQFAAMHRMAINTGYFSRVNTEKERKARDQLKASIINNELSSDSLYVFKDDVFWKIASSQVKPSDIAGVIDGFRIIAPNLKDCRNYNKEAIASISVESSHNLDYTIERIFFTSNGNGQKYQLNGWASPEPWGTWSEGDTALLRLELSNTPKSDVELLIEGHAYLADKHMSQEIDILVNKQYVATLKYNQQSNNGVRAVQIPKRLLLENNGRLLIKFNFKNPKSPAELGLSSDGRRLGLGIVSMELKPTD